MERQPRAHKIEERDVCRGRDDQQIDAPPARRVEALLRSSTKELESGSRTTEGTVTPTTDHMEQPLVEVVASVADVLEVRRVTEEHKPDISQGFCGVAVRFQTGHLDLRVAEIASTATSPQDTAMAHEHVAADFCRFDA